MVAYPISWKVRFLFKTKEFLVQQSKEKSKSNGNAALSHSGDMETSNNNSTSPKQKRQNSTFDVDFPGRLDIAYLHSDLISEDIERILSFVRLFLEPKSDEEPPLFSNLSSNPSSYFYVMITIWYLVKSGIKLSQASTAALDMSRSRLAIILSPGNSHFRQDENGETLLLRWYHYGSIAKLVQIGFLDDSWCGDGSDPGEITAKVQRLRRATKMALAAAIYPPRGRIFPVTRLSTGCRS